MQEDIPGLLRHNPVMLPAPLLSLLLVVSGLLAACNPARPPADVPLPQLEQDEGRVEWRGSMPCADCDGIETLLVLERRGGARRYDLVETFLAEPGGARFAESGQWRQEGGMISLEGESGALRRYALLADGRLQPRDVRGHAFPPREGDYLVPADAYAP